MRPMRADGVIELSEEQRAELTTVSRSRRTPQAVAQRARIVLMTAEGIAPVQIASELGVSQPTIRKWRARYVEDGLAGLRNEQRPGRPRTLSDQRVAELLNKALRTRPAKQTHWSVRSFAAEAEISKDMAHRLFRAAAIAPHRSRSFKLSNDPAFVEKVRDITGLYLDPPEHAMVLCVDEKSQIQALERTQPLLPMGLGYVEGVTHDYVRHGTTTLFAALNVANGTVISRVRSQHRHQEFLDFLRQIDNQTPAGLQLHLIVDNYATHKHPKVKAWLARHPRFHMHFTPTYSSWLNQVERWFALITERSIRRPSPAFENSSNKSNCLSNATMPTQLRFAGSPAQNQSCKKSSASRNVFMRPDTRPRRLAVDLQLKGRRALVTGASMGIGRAIAKQLAAEGVHCAIAARRTHLLEELAREIVAAGGPAPACIEADVMQEGGAERLAGEAARALGGVQILINSAGGSRPMAVAAPEEEWVEAMTLNFTRLRQLTHAVLPDMMKSRWGRVVNITGKSEPEHLNAANSAKAAVHAWSKGLSREVGQYGITVNCIPPGRIMSEQIRRKYSEEYRKEQSAKEIPIGRYGEPEELAVLAVFLSSPLAGYITGTVMPVDGGLRRYAF